jgi:hypothetical protein
MSIFQIVFIGFCTVQAALSLRRFAKTRHLAALGFFAVWILALGLIARPELSTRIAQSVGIGRGVDVVIYSLLIAFVWAHYQQYLRYKRVENQLTLLVRELAIERAARPISADPNGAPA